MSVFGVVLVRIFPALSCIQTEYGEIHISPYQSEYGKMHEKYGLEQLRILALFMQSVSINQFETISNVSSGVSNNLQVQASLPIIDMLKFYGKLLQNGKAFGISFRQKI